MQPAGVAGGGSALLQLGVQGNSPPPTLCMSSWGTPPTPLSAAGPMSGQQAVCCAAGCPACAEEAEMKVSGMRGLPPAVRRAQQC